MFPLSVVLLSTVLGQILLIQKTVGAPQVIPSTEALNLLQGGIYSLSDEVGSHQSFVNVTRKCKAVAVDKTDFTLKDNYYLLIVSTDELTELFDASQISGLGSLCCEACGSPVDFPNNTVIRPEDQRFEGVFAP
jgi:hypothetical protein